jgi:predicted nucleic acid-binding protein
LSVVVDASAVIELLTESPLAPSLRERLRPFQVLHAPHLIDLEVLQFIRGRRLHDQIDARRASQAIAGHLALPIKRYAHHTLLQRAWEHHANITAYDAIYVALAEFLHATLITSDLRLAKAAARFVDVETP